MITCHVVYIVVLTCLPFPFAVSECIDTIYLMAFTSGLLHAESDDSPWLCVFLTDGEMREVRFPDLPSDEFVQNKGDLYSFPIRSFGFSDIWCTKKNEISRVVIRNGGTNAWNIESIVTMIENMAPSGRIGEYFLLTADFHINSWIDGYGEPHHAQIDLTMV